MEELSRKKKTVITVTLALLLLLLLLLAIVLPVTLVNRNKNNRPAEPTELTFEFKLANEEFSYENVWFSKIGEEVQTHQSGEDLKLSANVGDTIILGFAFGSSWYYSMSEVEYNQETFDLQYATAEYDPEEITEENFKNSVVSVENSWKDSYQGLSMSQRFLLLKLKVKGVSDTGISFTISRDSIAE